jgi:tetratricopeptide (TPR) repeat protein
MNSRSPNSWTKPAIRVAAAGFGVAVAGPLGGALGGWLGAALGGPAAHLVEKYAEKFGDSAAEKLLDIGADSLVDRLKESAPDLAQAYRDALRQSLADVHREVHQEVRGGFHDCGFDDWFANWDLCLAGSIPLNLPPTHPDQLVPGKLDDLFLSTLKCLDAQGTAVREKSLSLSLDLKYREVPEALLSELNNRLPQHLKEDIDAILVTSEYEVGWKQTQLIFQEYVGPAVRRIDKATQNIDQRTKLLPQIDERLARLEKRAETELRPLRANPIPASSEHFLGREDDLKQILELVRGHRVVTVSGLGGIGKSEMAKAVARATSGEGWTVEGVFYIDLQSASDTNLVKSTLKSNLALDPNKPISNQLAGRRLYLLDDLYQALVGDRKGIQEFVRDLYTNAENAHFLLTSREPLGVIGVENLCPLGRLLPPHDANLFRSVAEASGYKWQDGDTERLATLLQQLDGYPLAIMIAANRLSDVSVETLLRRWENRHTEALNLPGISPAELSKMTSVDFSLVLSFNHLPEGEARALFALFADLPAGATGKTLETIMGDEVHDFLAYLVRGSLVQRQEDRYGMLVPVREFASKRRSEASSTLSQKLDAHLIALAEQWCGNSAVWNTSKRREGMVLLSAEELTFYAAGDRAKARKDNNFLLKLISASWQFLRLKLDSEKLLLDGVNAARAVQQVQIEANCLRSLGDVYRMDDGQLESAQEHYGDALNLYRSIADKSGEASCLEGLGDVQKQKDKPEEARQRYDAAVPLYNGQAEKLGEANCLRKIAELEEGGGPQTLKEFEAALALFRDAGDELGEANCLRSMAQIYVNLDNPHEGQTLLERALPLFRKLDDNPREGNCLMLLGRLHMRLEAYPSAAKEFEEARKVFTGMGNYVGQGFCLASFDDMRERIGEWIYACTGKAECVRWLGNVHVMLNEIEQATSCYTEALPLYRDCYDFEAGEASCRAILGDLNTDYHDALGHFEEASRLYALAGDQSKQAECLCKSGQMHVRLEQYEQAWTCFKQALDFYTDNSDKLRQAKCLRGLADVHLQRHQLDDAMQKYNEALKLYEGSDPSDDLAATYWGIGEASLEGGRRDDAVRWMEKAAELYESIDEADQAQQARNRVEEWRRDVTG